MSLSHHPKGEGQRNSEKEEITNEKRINRKGTY